MISEERSNAADFFVFSVYSSVEIVTGEEFHEPDAGRNGRLVGIEGGCMQFSGSGTDAQAVEDRRVAGAVEAEIFGSHAQGQHLKGNSFGFGQCDGLPDQLRVIDHARVAGVKCTRVRTPYEASFAAASSSILRFTSARSRSSKVRIVPSI